MKPNEKEPERKESPQPKEHVNKGAFERVPGPGPNDEGKGAAGDEALKRIERS
jgi:hypothetical protein